MSTNKFLYLLGLTLFIVLMAFFSTIREKNSNLFSERGKVFLENLTNEINALNKISITGRDLNMTLIKENNKFIDPSGYPFKEGVWESFITSLSLLRIEEKKTNDPKRLKELNLISSENFDENDDVNDPATQITFFKDNGQIYKSILLGKIDSSVGGISGGQFARQKNQNQSFLLKGALRMPSGKSDWFQSLLFTTQKDDLISSKLINKKLIFEVENKKNKLSLNNNPDLSIDEEKLSQIAEIVQSFYFYDVRKEVKSNYKNSPHLIFNFKDGLIIKIYFVELKNNSQEAWVKIKASETNKKMKEKADEINKKVLGYDFLANINTSDVLNWKLKNLIKK